MSGVSVLQHFEAYQKARVSFVQVSPIVNLADLLLPVVFQFFFLSLSGVGGLCIVNRASVFHHCVSFDCALSPCLEITYQL